MSTAVQQQGGDGNLPPAPVFGMVAPPANKTQNGNILSLDDLFDDFMYKKNQSAGNASDGSAHGADASGSGKTSSKDADEDDDDMSGSDDDGVGKKRKTPRGTSRSMTEAQKVERRERNREHAKRSRVRKKFLLESLQQSVHALQEENDKLKKSIQEHLPQEADDLLSTVTAAGPSLIASEPGDNTRTLDDPDYSLVKALQTAQQNFVISDPSMPDNPIVYASQGFLALTGYTLNQVLGRNCRFLQGPETDPRSVDKIRKGIELGEDTTVCLLNYRVDGSTFWNQFFIASLRDGDGNVVNYLGVQCKVSEDYARATMKEDAAAAESEALKSARSMK